MLQNLKEYVALKYSLYAIKKAEKDIRKVRKKLSKKEHSKVKT